MSASTRMVDRVRSHRTPTGAVARWATGVSRIANTRSAAARPSALSWKCTATCRSGQYASGASTMTTSPVRRSTVPPTSRSPVETATRATEIVVTNSSTADDRKATRSVAMVARRFSSVTRRIVSTWARARRNTSKVGSPSTTSRKWAPSVDSVRHRERARRWVVVPTRIANTGTSGNVARMISPASRSCDSTTATTTGGTTTAEIAAGRYRAKYASSASVPRVASVASSPVAFPDSHAGPSRTTCPSSCCRSEYFTSAEMRCADTSAAHANSARPMTTPASTSSGARNAATSAPC